MLLIFEIVTIKKLDKSVRIGVFVQCIEFKLGQNELEYKQLRLLVVLHVSLDNQQLACRCSNPTTSNQINED